MCFFNDYLTLVIICFIWSAHIMSEQPMSVECLMFQEASFSQSLIYSSAEVSADYFMYNILVQICLIH